MAEKHDMSAEHRTFSQRYDYELLPEPMQLEELSDDLRREIWNALREFLHGHAHIPYFLDTAKKFIERVLGKFLKISEDEIPTDYYKAMDAFKGILFKGKFNKSLDLVEIAINDKAFSEVFVNRIAKSFEGCAAAYWLDTSSRPFRFYPRSCREQGEATQQAIETIRESGMEGASAHLSQAAHHINAKQYADSVESSIEAVESVARRIAPKSKTLGDALKNLEKKGLLTNSQLKTGFEKIYAYTNSEEGVRHSLVFKDSSDVGLDEAVFMFGACASFAAYLVHKDRQMNQQHNGGQ